MIPHIINNMDDFLEYCPCANQIISFVESIEDTNVLWFFSICYYTDYDNRFTVFFKSFITHEYKDYLLSVEAKLNDKDTFDIRLLKKVDNLVNEIE